MNIFKSYHIYALSTVILWSLSYVFSRLAMEFFSPFSLGFLRYAAASAFLIFVVLIKKVRPPKFKDLPMFAASGAAGFFVYMIFFNLGTGMLSSATSSIIIATVPVMTAFFARFIYGEKLVTRQWFAIAIEFIGIVLLTLIGGTFTLNKGIIWLLLASVSLSTYNLIQKKITKKYTPLTASSYSIFLGSIMLCIFAKSGISEFLQAVSAVSIAYIIILGVFSSAIAYILWAEAFSKAENTSSVSNYMFITPFAAAILGFVFNAEVPDNGTLIGGIVIMFGVFLFFKDSFIKTKRK